MPLYESITDLRRGAATLRRRRYGVVEVSRGELVRVRFRPYPKLISLPEIFVADRLVHRRRSGDRLTLYYNQPRRFSNFLAVVSMVSERGTSVASFRAACGLMDAIAEIKGTDALLCDVSSRRISDRLMRRGGWEPHAPSLWHRNYIKRFYGVYPASVLGASSSDTTGTVQSMASQVVAQAR